MTLTSRIRRTVTKWLMWRAHKAIRREFLRDLDRKEAEYRRQHKRGSARIVKAKRQIVHAALSGRRQAGG